jgi:uncharacterized membrane protein YheB (UPF0754 family)
MEWLSYLLLPVIAAAIGWFTNWIAVKMLFHPRKKIRILFFDIQGIFPKRQYAMAEKIGKLVASELLNTSDFKDRINDPKNLESINQSIEAKVDQYLDETFPTKYPMMSMLLGKKARLKMKGDFLKEVQSVTPVVIDKYMENLEGTFDVEKIVRQKVSLLSPITLENLIMGILKKEFQFIELIGAVLGFMIGVIQVLLVLEMFVFS